MKPIFSLITGVLALSGLLSGCGRAPAQPQKPPPPAVTVETVAPATFERRLHLTGSVEAATLATLSSPAEGPVQDLRIREGDAVSRDEVLLVIGRDASAEALLVSSREEVNRQEREFARVEALVADRALPGEQLDAARVSLERARAQLAQAAQLSGDFIIRAPWDGLVSRLHVADGRYVAPRTPLVEIFDPKSLVLRFQVPEEHAFSLAVGDRLTAAFDAYGGQAFPLTIERAWPELDRRLRTRTFEARLPLDERSFAPGQFARIAVVLERVPDALTVPVEAVTGGNKDPIQVFTVDPEGIARRQVIQTGFEQDGRILVTSGLTAGDRVIINGIGRVKAGQPVRLSSSKPTAP